MAIKPPSWARNAVPTTRGWKHPNRNEILQARKISQQEIDEFYGIKPKRTRKVQPAVLTEAPTNEEEFVTEHFEDEEAEVLEEEDR